VDRVLAAFFGREFTCRLAHKSVRRVGISIGRLAFEGKFVRFAAMFAAAMLAGIVFANPANMIITFRDVGLICMALALVFAV